MTDVVRSHIVSSSHFKPAVSDVLEFHRLAMHQILPSAGQFRVDEVKIRCSQHVTPGFAQVRTMVEDMLHMLVTDFAQRDALDAAAYIMWRTNWIHPFDDGNGRTARALAFAVLFCRLGRLPVSQPNVPSFLDRLSWRKLDYVDALEHADSRYKHGATDISMLAQLLDEVITASLAP
jgi:Fic family protein